LLLHVEVYETDAIISNLLHTCDDEILQVESHGGKLHISEDSGVLKIHIAKNKKDQELCFLQLLSTKLFKEVLMNDKSENGIKASDSEAARIIATMFISSDEAVHDLLDAAGVISVPFTDVFDVEAYDQTPFLAKPLIQHGGHSQTNMGTGSFGLPRDTIRQWSGARINSVLFFSFPPREYLPFTVDSGQEQHLKLLDNIISMAKSKRGRFPTQGVFNFNDLRSALPTESEHEHILHTSYSSTSGPRSAKLWEHHLKLGAAGELYVSPI
jgi:hypothetical protein